MVKGSQSLSLIRDICKSEDIFHDVEMNSLWRSRSKVLQQE